MPPHLVCELVRRAGGVARTRSLCASGASKHRIAAAVADGALIRPGRGWVALPDADADLVSAAHFGVVLTCVTQAQRLGLWVLDASRPHVAALPHAHVRPTVARVHWATPVVPRHPDSLVDCVENVLTLVAQCRPREEALAIWESALHQRAVDRDVLARLPLPPAGRELLAVATPWSMSGLESFVPERLRWLRLSIVPQAWVLGHRVDFLIGERLVLQIDGGHHVGRQREEDIAHDAELMLRGFHVIRVGYFQVVDRWPEVQDLVMRAVAVGLHRAP